MLVLEASDPPRKPLPLKQLARTGAIWVTLTSAAAVPLTYYRNWILAQLGDSGQVVGYYAILLLFTSVTTTFFLFGGSSVVTNFLPKIHDDDHKSAFLFTYALISLFLVGVFTTVINVCPALLNMLLRQPLDGRTLLILSLLAPVTVFSELVTYSLAGLMQFRLSAILGRLQLLLVCIVATCATCFIPTSFPDNAVAILAATVIVANIAIVAIGLHRVIRCVSHINTRMYLPVGFWKFSSFVHTNTLFTFAYQNIDTLFVLTALGTHELGAYFVLWQCAQLIRFVPDRIGQVMLASFSHLVASKDHAALIRAYTQLCRIIILMGTPIAIFLVIFSRPIATLFGEWYASRHIYLVLLATTMQIAVLGSINAMLIMAKERTSEYLINSVAQITTQLATTILLLDDYGVFAVIAGKAAGVVVAQIGLFSILRWRLGDIHLPIPPEYWISVVCVLATTSFVLSNGPLPPSSTIPLAMATQCSFLLLVRFRFSEFLKIFLGNHTRSS